jgi:hypothetical protein
MRTKIFSVILIALMAVFTVHSQDPGIRVGILGGINFSNLTIEEDGEKLDTDLHTGFHAGVNLLIPIGPEFNFQPGLLFSGKGTKTKIGETATFNLSYVELPLNLLYRAELGQGFVMIGFGPYLGYGIGGKIKAGGIERDITFKNTVDEDDSDDVFYLKTFDAGANIFVGYELSTGLFFQLNSQLGLLNLNPDYPGESADDGSIKNTGFGLSVGYRF